MPQRPYQLDTGFDIPKAPPPKQTPHEVDQGNFFTGAAEAINEVGALLTPGVNVAHVATKWDSVYGPAFRQENDVVNFIDLATRPSFKADPTFDLEKHLRETGMWDQYRQNFLGVQSMAEFTDKANRIAREEQDKNKLRSAGPSGMVAMALAGFISPVNLIPFVGTGLKGAKAVGAALAFGAATGALQELPLQANQELRTTEDSLWSVGMSTVVAGVLGGAIAFANRPLQHIADDMVRPVDGNAIPDAPFARIGVGAEAAPDHVSAGRMKGALGQEGEFISKLGPVTRVLSQDVSPQAQNMMAQLADGGVQLSGNARGIATSVGGTAENRILTHQARVAETIRTIDDTYTRYMLGKSGKTNMGEVMRANLAGLNPRRTKLSRSEFKVEVSRALRNGESEIPEAMEAATFIRKTVYDPLFEEAQKLGLYKGIQTAEDGAPEVVGDLSYLNRDYNIRAIQANRQTFIGKLATHFEGKLTADFQAALPKLLDKVAKTKQRLDDMRLPPEEVDKLRKQFMDELGLIDQNMTPDDVFIEDLLGDTRSMMRDKTLSDSQRADAREMLKMLEDQGGARLADRVGKRREIKRRLSNLNRSFATKASRQAAKLDRVAAIEENTIGTLNRLVRASQKFLNKLDGLTDVELDKELSELRTKFAKVGDDYDRGSVRINKLAADETVQIDELIAADLRQQDKAERLNLTAEAIDELDQMDRVTVRAAVQAGLDEALTKAARINGRRYARAERLEAAAKELGAEIDPKAMQKEVDRLIGEDAGRQADFFDRWKERGAKSIKLEEGFMPDFNAYAKQMANTVTDKILGTNVRLPGMDLIMEPKGAELARVLDIDSNEIEPFLVNDVESLVSSYVRTVAPDIEITKKLGDYAPDMGRNYEFEKLNQEADAADAKLRKDMATEGKTPEQIEKAALKLADQYTAIRRDLQAVIGRLRHQWGLPKDPIGMAARLGRVALNLNVLRYMNMVTVSSIPDIAQPIHRYGLLRTFRSGFVPFIQGLTQLQFTPRELRLSGASIDMILHSRAHQMSDIQDLMVRGSKFEKGLEYASSKIGLIALFDGWTTAMKNISGTVANAVLMDDLKIITDLSGGMRDTGKAIERLAAAGIDADLAKVIWKEISKPGGSDVVNGVLWPNTEAWDNSFGAVDAYRSALLREVNRTIITPGVERPLITDSTMIGRLLFQFKSFGLSSTSRTMLADLQQRDMAVVSGTLTSLALGAISYYIWANIAGGKAKADMEQAIAEGDWGKFADEAISRSGVLASLQMGLDAASTIPMVAPYVTFAGERTTRSEGNDLMQQLAGPTFGDLLSGAADVVTGLRDPTQSAFMTKSTQHKLRQMLPFQNHFAFRQMLDAIEAASPAPRSRAN